MTYDSLIKLFCAYGFFDLASVVQLSDEPRDSIRKQLYRWCKNDKLLSLRRGMYAFPDRYNQRKIDSAEIANHIYAPSYLSSYWALGYFGLIPEKVVTYTSVTSRVTRKFGNCFGVFSYQHVKQASFFGYRPMRINNRKVLIAEPEKAMIDLWYLSSGLWSEERMFEMRFQNSDLIDEKKLYDYATRVNSSRVSRAVTTWIKLMEIEKEGTVTL